MTRPAGSELPPGPDVDPYADPLIAFESARYALEAIAAPRERQSTVRYARMSGPIGESEQLKLSVEDYGGAGRILYTLHDSLSSSQPDIFYGFQQDNPPDVVRRTEEALPRLSANAAEQEWIQDVWQEAQAPRSELTSLAVERLMDGAPASVGVGVLTRHSFRGLFGNGTRIDMQRSEMNDVLRGQEPPGYPTCSIKLITPDAIHRYIRRLDGSEELYVYRRPSRPAAQDDEQAFGYEIADTLASGQAMVRMQQSELDRLGSDRQDLDECVMAITAALQSGLVAE